MAMQRQVKAGFVALAALVLAMRAFAQSEPAAQEILRSARLNQSTQHRVLEGQLRTEDVVTPFRLTLNGGEIRYDFSNPPQSIVLKLSENGSQLFEQTQSSMQKVTPAKFDQKVRGTDITYEDLALKFLYWPKAKIDGEEMKLTRRCWKLHLEPGARGESQYAVVLLWVEKQSGAFLEAEGYGADGKISKRFKVISGQRTDTGWILKQMRIEQLSGMNSRDKSPTYFEINGLEK